MSIGFVMAWYDLWIGAFWDGQKRRLYLLPIPCCGIVIQFVTSDPTGTAKEPRTVLRARDMVWPGDEPLAMVILRHPLCTLEWCFRLLFMRESLRNKPLWME